MKYPNIVHTEFIDELIDELNLVAFNLGIKKSIFTAEVFHFNLAFELIEKYIQQLTEDLELVDDFADALELKQTIDSMDNTTCDLGILQDLEGTEYATPDHIASSIEVLSTKLSSQLEAKIHGEASYNKHYCNRLAECLKELCEIIL